MLASEQDCAAAATEPETGSFPSIDVQYVGNRSVVWFPSPHTSSDETPTAATTTTTTPEQGAYTRANFIQYLCHLTDEDDHDEDEDDEDEDDEDMDSREKLAIVRQKLLDRVALAVARDPTSTMEKWFPPRSAAEANRPIQRHFRGVLLLMAAQMEAVCRSWRSDQRGRDAALAAVEGEDDAADADLPGCRRSQPGQGKGKGKAASTSRPASTRQATTAGGRSTADRAAAQACVPTWYNGRCVLSGLVKPHGAHIVPVRASAKGRAVDVWDLLLGFWEPLCRRPFGGSGQPTVKGQEPVCNILPLSPDAHGLWDRFQFGLRPVEHPDTLLRPDEPPRRLFVQMVWLDRVGANDDGVDSGDRDHSHWGSIVDFRRGQLHDKEVLYPPIRHGDVYELVTLDPVNRPLPSFHMLQIQLGVHKLMAGVRAAGADPALFGRHAPPDEDEDTRPAIPAGLKVPPMWEVALASAVEAGILDMASAARWGKAAIRHEYCLFDAE